MHFDAATSSCWIPLEHEIEDGGLCNVASSSSCVAKSTFIVRIIAGPDGLFVGRA